MKVTIMYRNSFEGGDGWTFYPREIEISDWCPQCGIRRGIPYPKQYCEDGEFYTVHNWDNPCGHVDSYKEVYLESKGITDSGLPEDEENQILKISNAVHAVSQFEDEGDFVEFAMDLVKNRTEEFWSLKAALAFACEKSRHQ